MSPTLQQGSTSYNFRSVPKQQYWLGTKHSPAYWEDFVFKLPRRIMSSRLAWATQQDPVSILEQQQQQRQLWVCQSESNVETKANTVMMGGHKLKSCVSKCKWKKSTRPRESDTYPKKRSLQAHSCRARRNLKSKNHYSKVR